MGDSLTRVGRYKQRFNELLDLNIDEYDIMVSDYGLRTHMVNRGHADCLQYVDCLPEIINHPTYIGINPNENGTSFELIKDFGDNILVGIKLDTNNSYFYVSTIYKVQQSKINRRLNSGRIKSF